MGDKATVKVKVKIPLPTVNPKATPAKVRPKIG